LIYDPLVLGVGGSHYRNWSSGALGHVGDSPDVRLGRVVIGAGAVVNCQFSGIPDVPDWVKMRGIAAGAVVVRGAVR